MIRNNVKEYVCGKNKRKITNVCRIEDLKDGANGFIANMVRKYGEIDLFPIVSGIASSKIERLLGTSRASGVGLFCLNLSRCILKDSDIDLFAWIIEESIIDRIWKNIQWFITGYLISRLELDGEDALKCEYFLTARRFVYGKDEDSLLRIDSELFQKFPYALWRNKNAFGGAGISSFFSDGKKIISDLFFSFPLRSDSSHIFSGYNKEQLFEYFDSAEDKESKVLKAVDSLCAAYLINREWERFVFERKRKMCGRMYKLYLKERELLEKVRKIDRIKTNRLTLENVKDELLVYPEDFFPKGIFKKDILSFIESSIFTLFSKCRSLMNYLFFNTNVDVIYFLNEYCCDNYLYELLDLFELFYNNKELSFEELLDRIRNPLFGEKEFFMIEPESFFFLWKETKRRGARSFGDSISFDIYYFYLDRNIEYIIGRLIEEGRIRIDPNEYDISFDYYFPEKIRASRKEIFDTFQSPWYILEFFPHLVDLEFVESILKTSDNVCKERIFYLLIKNRFDIIKEIGFSNITRNEFFALALFHPDKYDEYKRYIPKGLKTICSAIIDRKINLEKINKVLIRDIFYFIRTFRKDQERDRDFVFITLVLPPDMKRMIENFNAKEFIETFIQS